MKTALRLLLAATLPMCPALHAQQQPSADEIRATAAASSKEMLQRLFGNDTTEEELGALSKQARQIGVPQQQIIEARLVWGLRNQNTAYLVKMLPEVEALAASFDSNLSAAMGSAEAVKSFASYIRALKARDEGKAEEFKKHILEAVWLFPSQSQVFALAIETMRREDKMSTLKVDLALPVTTSMGETTTLGDQVAGKKAILIDFWASWCGPCMQLMPSLKKKGKLLEPHGIAVIAMNKDDENAESIAERIRKEQDMKIPWLVEPAERPFTKLFEIDSIPRMILIDPSGKVLFNGHPEDPALWTALKKIHPKIEAPQ